MAVTFQTVLEDRQSFLVFREQSGSYAVHDCHSEFLTACYEIIKVTPNDFGNCARSTRMKSHILQAGPEASSSRGGQVAIHPKPLVHLELTFYAKTSGIGKSAVVKPASNTAFSGGGAKSTSRSWASRINRQHRLTLGRNLASDARARRKLGGGAHIGLRFCRREDTHTLQMDRHAVGRPTPAEHPLDVPEQRTRMASLSVISEGISSVSSTASPSATGKSVNKNAPRRSDPG